MVSLTWQGVAQTLLHLAAHLVEAVGQVPVIGVCDGIGSALLENLERSLRLCGLDALDGVEDEVGHELEPVPTPEPPSLRASEGSTPEDDTT